MQKRPLTPTRAPNYTTARGAHIFSLGPSEQFLFGKEGDGRGLLYYWLMIGPDSAHSNHPLLELANSFDIPNTALPDLERGSPGSPV
jgi:hypothetical protein